MRTLRSSTRSSTRPYPPRRARTLNAQTTMHGGISRKANGCRRSLGQRGWGERTRVRETEYRRDKRTCTLLVAEDNDARLPPPPQRRRRRLHCHHHCDGVARGRERRRRQWLSLRWGTVNGAKLQGARNVNGRMDGRLTSIPLPSIHRTAVTLILIPKSNSPTARPHAATVPNPTIAPPRRPSNLEHAPARARRPRAACCVLKRDKREARNGWVKGKTNGCTWNGGAA